MVQLSSFTENEAANKVNLDFVYSFLYFSIRPNSALAPSSNNRKFFKLGLDFLLHQICIMNSGSLLIIDVD